MLETGNRELETGDKCLKGVYISNRRIPLITWLPIACLILGMAFLYNTAYAGSDPRPHRSGLKIEVSKAGVYRLTGADLSAAGVNPASIDPATLRMFHVDSEIAVHVKSGEGGFDGSAYIDFYATGIDNQYTGTDVYWLYWGGTSTGIRMKWVDGSVGEATPQVSSFIETLSIEENHTPWLDTPGAPDTDYWFWEKLTAPQTATHPFDIPDPVNNTEAAMVTACFQGRSDVSQDTPHHTVIKLNGHTIGDDSWSGGGVHAQDMTVSQNLLHNGSNTLTLESKGDGVSPDVIYFNRITIGYRRQLEAVNNRLLFAINRSEPVCAIVSGFSDQDIKVFDTTDPANVKIVSNADIQADQSGFSVRFEAQAGQKTFLAFSADAVQTPDSMTYRRYSDLKDSSNGADYILITSDELMPALEKLCELRTLQGMRVKMVDIEDIYDEFSFGFFDPEALHDFLKYAHDNWEPPAPQYVLLAGDSNLDYRDYYGTGKKNIVPVYLSITEGLGLTPSDNRYACVDGDDPIPDIYIGRIPGDSPDTVSAITTKLIYYESTKAKAGKSALFVADDDDPAFEGLNDDLATYLPPDIEAERVYTRFYPNLADATDDILGFVDAGMLVTSFVGHGDVTRWGAEPFGGGDFIIEPGDLDRLANKDRLTFIIALDCLNGYFSQSFHYCLAEEWVMATDKGAVACFAPSGLSHQQEHEFLSYFIFSKIFLDGENRLGAITTGSKVDAYAVGASDKVLISFNLIGDPATRLAYNRKASDLVTVHTINADAGSGGTISPAGEVLVFDKSSQTFAVTPDSGYRVADIVVDGVSRGGDREFTFNNVTSDRTIHAVFEAEAKPGGGGGGGGGCFVCTMMP